MLELSGKFSDCISIVMGECTNCPPAYNTSYEDLINAFIVPLGKPLMTNVTTGHGRFKAAIPIGAIGNLDTVNNTFSVEIGRATCREGVKALGVDVAGYKKGMD